MTLFARFDRAGKGWMGGAFLEYTTKINFSQPPTQSRFFFLDAYLIPRRVAIIMMWAQIGYILGMGDRERVSENNEKPVVTHTRGPPLIIKPRLSVYVTELVHARKRLKPVQRHKRLLKPSAFHPALLEARRKLRSVS